MPKHKLTLSEINDLFQENIGIAYSILNTYYGRRHTDHHLTDDMEQAALIGLWTAIMHWDKDKGALSTIAGYHIMNELNEVIRKQYAVTIPMYAYNKHKIRTIGTANYDEIAEFELDSTDNTKRDTVLYQLSKTPLTELQKEALGYFLKGENIRQLAKEKGVTRSSIDNAYRKAIENIKKYAHRTEKDVFCIIKDRSKYKGEVQYYKGILEDIKRNIVNAEIKSKYLGGNDRLTFHTDLAKERCLRILQLTLSGKSLLSISRLLGVSDAGLHKTFTTKIAKAIDETKDKLCTA